MPDDPRYTSLLQDGGRLLLLVVDGLGGYPERHRGSELEEAATPNLDDLAANGICGLLEPAGPGITVGSGPGHLALFGYDPWRYDLGRGVLAAVGTGFDLQPGDVAARGNYCTLDGDGLLTDRRAGRPTDDVAAPATARVEERLRDAAPVEGVEVFLRHVSEHRVLLVLRGEGLDPGLADTDPQETGVEPLAARPRADAGDADAAARTGAVVDRVAAAIRDALAEEDIADGVLLRGFDGLRELPAFGDRTGLRAAAIASYPMYRGVASLVGMDVLGPPATMADQIELAASAARLGPAGGRSDADEGSERPGELAAAHRDDYDYLFVHHKHADAAGHDGDRERKIAALEQLDLDLPDLLAAADADVIAVSGDHASPTALSGHSWHPVPTILAGGSAGVDDVRRVGERACATGLLGRRPTADLMPLMLGAAGRLAKYGA